MIQRIQSVYLLVVTILMVVCMCSPVGSIIASTQEISEFGNLCITLPDGTKDYAPWALFVILSSGSLVIRYHLPPQETHVANPSDYFQQCGIGWLLFGIGGLHLHVGRKHQLHSFMDHLFAFCRHHPELVGHPRYRC